MNDKIVTTIVVVIGVLVLMFVLFGIVEATIGELSWSAYDVGLAIYAICLVTFMPVMIVFLLIAK